MELSAFSLDSRLNRLDISNVVKIPLIGDRVDFPADVPTQSSPPQDDSREERKENFSGFIIIRLASEVPTHSTDSDTLQAVAKSFNLRGLEAILDVYDLSVTRRLIRSHSPETILKLEQEMTQSVLRPLRSLSSYWRIDVRQRIEQIREIYERLNDLPEVDLAYPELVVSDPLVVNAADDPYNATQSYLDAAPDGIDARWAWMQPNGCGGGVGVVDLEQGWFLNHEDYVSKSPTLLFGDNRDGVGTYVGNHGTAVLGEIVADDNTTGVVGIAPDVGTVRVTSHYDAATNTPLHVADAILAAITVMAVGDVLLLEVQRGSGLPTEIDAADFDAIRLAVASGIIVVEAAGNGNNNLDTYTDISGDAILNPADVDFRESGAIIVGAGNSALPHNRASFSTFGARVNCYAWGNNVTTCGYGDLDAGGGDNARTYTDTFSGTSSASPIVTGAALILQGMYEANTGTRLSPLQMRALLSNPLTGTPQGGGVAGNIGVMPNLRAIITNTLNLAPDVYLRDNVMDTGAVPTVGSISASPDIIVRPSAIANPQAAFGQGSGVENSTTIGFEAEAGQDNSIYVRMKNRGGASATDVTATVYWSEVSTLVTPDMWNLIGTTNPVTVNQGDTLVVSDALNWAAADIPGQGHYCFVGILDHPGDPAPPLPAPTDWNGFRNFIRNQNNVTWRNFNVVDLDPDTISDPSVMPFLIAGAPDERRVFDLEIVQCLAREVRVILEVPMGVAKFFLEGRQLKYEVDREQEQIVRIFLPATPRLYIPEVLLSKAARLRCRFVVEGVKEHVQRGNRLVIRQLFEQQEVGRVTWLFHDRRDDKPC